MKTPNDEAMNPAALTAEKTLRVRASERLQIQQDRDISTLEPEEAKRLIHELQLHQIELELQNDELRRIQETLEVAQGRYIDLYDFAPVGYLSVSKAGLILKANLTAAALFGVPRTAMIKQPLSRFILPEDQDIYYQHHNQFSGLYAVAPEPFNELRSCELQMLKKDKTTFWAQLNVSKSTYSNGTAVFRIVLSDITKHKVAEEALRQSELREKENRFQNLFIQHSAVMLILDAETGRIVDANKAAVRFYGWSIEELRQMNILEINTLPSEALLSVLVKAAESEGRRFEFRHHRADGSIREVEVFSNGLESEGNKFLVSIIHDITGRKQAEESLRQHAAELASAKATAENEKRLLTVVLESLPVGIAIADVSGNISQKNTAYERIWGGSGFQIQFTEEKHNDLNALWDSTGEPIAPAEWPSIRSLRKGESTAGQVIRLERDGSQVYIIKSASPVFDNNGILFGCAVAIQDITELKQTERALREREKDFDLAQEVGNIGSWRLDIIRNVLTWSDENYRIFGVPKGTLLSYDSFLSKIHPDDRVYVDTRWHQALSGAPYDLEHRIVVDDRVNWVREKAYLEFDRDGKLAGGFGITEDITDRRLAEENLRKSEERYRVLAETMLQGVVHQDHKGNVIAMNQAAENILGMNRDQFLTGISDEAEHPTIHENGSRFPALKHPASVALRTGQTVRNVVMGVFNPRLDEYRWLRIDSIPFFSHGAELPSEVFTVFEDITERNKVEAALREQERIVRALINSVDESIYLFGINGEILAANETTARRLGLTVEELVGQKWQKLMPTELVMMRTEKVNEILRTGIPLHFEDERDGIFFGHSAYPVFDENSAISALAVFSRDITKRKMSDAALKKSQDQLQILNRELEQMVELRTLELQETQRQFLHAGKLSAIGKLSASIAHEFNNPLQGILSVLKGLMKRAILEEEDRELLGEAIEECDRIKDLIRSLQEFNRPSSGRKMLMDVNKVVDSVLLLYKSDFQGKRISVVRDFAQQLPQIQAVSDQLKQVFLNILINAVDACQQRGGMITVTTWHEDEDSVAVAIGDNGVGINPSEIAMIFQPFYTTKPEVKGTGLGLSVCHGIIKNHNGAIRVESQPGRGSTFTVVLPINSADTVA